MDGIETWIPLMILQNIQAAIVALVYCLEYVGMGKRGGEVGKDGGIYYKEVHILK